MLFVVNLISLVRNKEDPSK